MSFLQLDDKTILLFGVANRRSVAYHVSRVLEEAGARVLYVVRSEERKESVAKLLKDRKVFVCDVEQEEQIARLRAEVTQETDALHGILHSIAFADYSDGIQPFHETGKAQFLQAVDISCYSLTAMSNAMQELLHQDASVVAISISTTRMASESYGYMAPIKAALDSSLAFLTKSFSNFSRVRFNAVGAGLLKTSASAGNPRVCRCLPVCRAGDPPQGSPGHGRSRQRGGISVEPALQRNHSADVDRGCGDVDQLFRPGHRPQGDRVSRQLALATDCGWVLAALVGSLPRTSDLRH